MQVSEKRKVIETFNRREMKFLIDAHDFDRFENDLSEYMMLDAYNKQVDFYTISNIYYDTENSLLIRNSIDKPRYKEKLRLRSYDNTDINDIVFLEIKKKVDHLVNKRRTKIALKDAYAYINGDIEFPMQDYTNVQVAHEIEAFMSRYKKLYPKTLISYDRRAFFGKDDPDFRVTFDKNIRARRDRLCFEEGFDGVPVLPDDKYVMEVKILNSYPLWMTQLLSKYGIYRQRFSKYGTEYKKNKQKVLYNIGG